ncbi:penicillin acylase family protein [Luteimonas aestuarii]|uniref:Penicillin acylase family protein n=1 Tax=Luteimonas aestuarii TaxID=453837 RepID=A0A4R5U4L9_9GAMM|nr:penicillin acylase family protein [Luteimonas aestuarii]TDK28712.1 penicillin acylase family protein [Luteimonas aestuarii]
MVRWLRRLLLLLLALLLIVALLASWLVRGSLPALDGEMHLPGLSAPATLQRDALGVVTIEAASETDAARALGYVHAQERFFEMDLLRRTSAGELAALFGPVALDTDKRHRVHRMRARVMDNLDAIIGDKGDALRAYTEGVNAGLSTLRVRPWPYLLLRQTPQPWTEADSALAGYAMYFDLQDSGNTRELALWKLRPHLPEALFALLTHGGSRWDAPLSGEGFGDAVLPVADEVDLRALPAPDDDAESLALTPPSAPSMVPHSAATRERGIGGSPAATGFSPGSNNFAVSGELTADGRAIVADDMHLGLRAPNIWFRARLRYPDAWAPGGRVDVQGFTLPGLPAVIVGSNGHVAWGFTNSYGDYLDWALETPCGENATEGCTDAVTHVERIDVAGDAPLAFDVRETRWGPILHDAGNGSVLSLRWVAHLRGSINFGLADFAHAADLDEALAIADRTATPTQNLVVGDAVGNIAWRLLGPLPERRGGCSAGDLVANDPAEIHGLASESAPAGVRRERCYRWDINTTASPSTRSPDTHRLWTANARVVSDADLERIGDGGYALGVRQQQIRDQLLAKDRFTEQDLLAIQLDDRALLLSNWHTLLQDRAKDNASSALRELADAARDWSGRASVDSAGYRLVRAWRQAVLSRVADGLVAPARVALGDAFEMPDLPQLEGVAWPLVTTRPPHLLSKRFETWDALFEDAAREVRTELAPHGPLAERTWGERNTARICHPLAGALPSVLRSRLCMPADPLPGDGLVPRVQGPGFGASQRMVVSPGREAEGIAHMPGGQSGHPLSPFWGAGHDDWVHGRPSPFLPGPTRHRLTLSPSL